MLSIKLAPLRTGIAGRSRDGKTVYIDPSTPLWMHRAIREHEQAEAKFMQAGMSYEGAHQKATSVERNYCESKGLDWLDYDRTYKRLLAKVKQSGAKEPADLFRGEDGERLHKEKARDYRQEYLDYHGSPKHIKERAERNAARRKLGLHPHDGKEADHKNPLSNGGSNSKRNLRAVSRATNRKKGSKVQKRYETAAVPEAYKLLKIECTDDDNHLQSLIEHIAAAGNGGHSFSIIVDPDLREETKRFSFDGDGSDHIWSVTAFQYSKDRIDTEKSHRIMAPSALDRIVWLQKADWEERKHPRASNGQFGSGGGKGKESQGAKRKRTAQVRRAESTAQTQLGQTDHIQTLLSGGSALDKIGWLNTTKKPTAEKKPEQERPKEETARPKSKIAQEIAARGIQIPPPPKEVAPGERSLNMRTSGGTDVPLKVNGYKQAHKITIDPPITVKGVKVGGSADIITTKINGRPTEVLRVSTAKGPAMLTIDTGKLKSEIGDLPEKQYTAQKVTETIDSDGIPIDVKRWKIDGGSRTTSAGNYINDAELGRFLDDAGVSNISVKDAMKLYEQVMETPEKLERQREQNARSSVLHQYWADMEEMEGGRPRGSEYNPSGYASNAPPKYKAPKKPVKPEQKPFPQNPKPGDEFRNEYNTVFVADEHGRWQNAPLGYVPKDRPTEQTTSETATTASQKPHRETPATTPKPAAAKPGAGNGTPAPFTDIFGSDPGHIKVDGNVDYTKPYILRISGKTYDHRDNLKKLGFKWGSTSQTWYKGIEPNDGDTGKAALLDHIKGVSGGKGAVGHIKATVQNGKLVPKKRGMSELERSMFGLK